MTTQTFPDFLKNWEVGWGHECYWFRTPPVYSVGCDRISNKTLRGVQMA